MTIDIRELQERLKEALASGGEVIVYDGAIPCARLLPIPSIAPRVPGLHPGALIAADDFDAPLPDEYWAHETAA